MTLETSVSRFFSLKRMRIALEFDPAVARNQSDVETEGPRESRSISGDCVDIDHQSGRENVPFEARIERQAT